MTRRPRLLDLFCGAGGCSVGYDRAGFDVTGVDIASQPRYPFKFYQEDALGFLESHGHEFDVIHASPPCQAFSTMKTMPNRRVHGDLLTPIRAMLSRTRKPWVIENVVGAPIELGSAPLFTDECAIMLCGTMFGLNNGAHELRRHRLFESSVLLTQPRCNHRFDVIGFYGDHARTRQRTTAGNRNRGGDIVGLTKKMPLVSDLMGIDWMNWRESTQAIPPAYTEFIGRRIVNTVTGATPL